MTTPPTPIVHSNGVDMRKVGLSIARFTVAEGVVIALLSWVMGRFIWTDAASQQAVMASAWVAFLVQILTFSICRLVAVRNVIAGWGIGTVLRFATAGVWAFLGIKALGLQSAPALLSLVTFFFVSTLIEPLFLNA